jgi:uncharacterized membrane protein
MDWFSEKRCGFAAVLLTWIFFHAALDYLSNDDRQSR